MKLLSSDGLYGSISEIRNTLKSTALVPFLHRRALCCIYFPHYLFSLYLFFLGMWWLVVS